MIVILFNYELQDLLLKVYIYFSNLKYFYIIFDTNNLIIFNFPLDIFDISA